MTTQRVRQDEDEQQEPVARKPIRRRRRRAVSRPSKRVGAERIVRGIFGAYSPEPIFEQARGEGGRFA